ncbi:hypothetical protein Ciccas_003822 [Cichlidogyrus casuarinus]|uniref:Laminin EGF-like domain-containing protein n=1 Tax=Cichlidogyrus casuarinus TaxID=1844966 RepID=A0ABD2QD96_9PLAT
MRKDGGLICESCECSPIGTRADENGQLICNMYSGKCQCKHNTIAGDKCDKCQENYWGFSENGCKQCQNCGPKYRCDPKTGECICPEGSEKGPSGLCDQCSNGYFYDSSRGECITVLIKSCNCHEAGTERGQCDVNGKCKCKLGYDGAQCNECKMGYFGFPGCEPCNCNKAGSFISESIKDIDSALVPCDSEGKCLCKGNVQGEKCDQCKLGTFGLTQSYPLGCYRCFCHPLDSKLHTCEGRLVEEGPSSEAKSKIINPDIKTLTLGYNYDKSFILLDDDLLKGDKTNNYGNILLKFNTVCEGNCFQAPAETDQPPKPFQGRIREDTTRIYARIVSMIGKDKIELIYQPHEDNTLNAMWREIWLRDKDWVIKSYKTGYEIGYRPIRRLVMLALTNIVEVYVKVKELPKANSTVM